MALVGTPVPCPRNDEGGGAVTGGFRMREVGSVMGEETSKERLDRELIELLNELRILLPGVQVLFAFLLTVPFNTGFSNATTFHRSLLLVALLATAFAIGLLVAPAAQHRILFRARAQEKRRLLWRSNLFAISGVLLLAVAVVVSVLLVVDYLFQLLVASICAGLVATVLVSTWLVQPIIQPVSYTHLRAHETEVNLV